MKPPNRHGYGPAKGTLHHTLSTTKIFLQTTLSAFLGYHLGMYSIFLSDDLFASGAAQAETAHGSLLTAFLHALPQLPPRGWVLIFFSDALWFLHITGWTSSPLFRPITVAIEASLITPSRSFTGFWASPKWTWPGQQDWTQQLWDRESQEYFTLPNLGHDLPSKAQMFEDWASDFTFPGDDYRQSQAALANKLSVTLHPFVEGAMSVCNAPLGVKTQLEW
jgi:hypothetical protein